MKQRGLIPNGGTLDTSPHRDREVLAPLTIDQATSGAVYRVVEEVVIGCKSDDNADVLFSLQKGTHIKFVERLREDHTGLEYSRIHEDGSGKEILCETFHAARIYVESI